MAVDDFTGGQVSGEGDEFVDPDEAGSDFWFVGEGIVGGADEDEFIVSEGFDFDASAPGGKGHQTEVSFSREDVTVNIG